MSDVHPEPRYTPIGPEPKGSKEIGPDFGMVPVEVGLGGVEHVQIELTVAYGFPSAAGENTLPVCWGLGLVWTETWG